MGEQRAERAAGERSFVHESSRQRVVFGVGTLAMVGAELDRLGASRALVLSTRGHGGLAEQVAALLGSRSAGVFRGAVEHTPVEVTGKALEVASAVHADVVVSVGGGSTTGLGKAVSSRLRISHLVVPTTYAGSELTAVLGETAGGEKITRSAPHILPDAVIYDVELTVMLPWPITVTSAANAMAHAVEGLYAKESDARTDEMATQAIRSLHLGLRSLWVDSGSIEARAELLYGAWLAGSCLAAVGMGLHHKLCHVLGGSFGLPHASTHAVVLPYAMEYNAPAAPQAMRKVAQALDATDPARTIQLLIHELGGPSSLRALGFAEADIDRAALLATSRRYPNPREVTQRGVIELLSRALDGEPVTAKRP
jgi:maleylacetate reductase